MRAHFTARRLLATFLLTSAGVLASTAHAEPTPPSTWEPLDVPRDEQSGVGDVSLLARAPAGPTLLIDTFDAATELRQLADGAFQPLTSVAYGRGALTEHDGNFYVCTGPGIVVRRWDGRSWAQLGDEVTGEAGITSRRGSSECSVTFDKTGAPLVAWLLKSGAKAWRTAAARWDGVAGRWSGLNDSLSSGQAAGFSIDRRSAQGIVLAYGITGTAASRRVLTRVYQGDGTTFSQLGADGDLSGVDPELAVLEQTPYVALGTSLNSPSALTLYRWTGVRWDLAASIPDASPVKLTFTSGGRPLVVAEEPADGAPSRLVLSVIEGPMAQRLGILPTTPGADIRSLDVDVDASGRPIVAWTERTSDAAAGDVTAKVRVARLSVPVP